MRSEKDMLDLIIKVAKRDERIRGVQMRGSRINPQAVRDRFQDFNIVFFVKELDTFKAYHKWMRIFGEQIMMRSGNTKNGGFSYQILLNDGNKLDIELLPSDRFYINNDLIILYSKDSPKPAPPELSNVNGADLPTQEEFLAVCDTFWWHTQYVVKGIARDELAYADHFLGILRRELFKVIEWCTGSSGSLGRYARFLKSNLKEQDYNLVKSTFADGNLLNIWKALLAMCGIFRDAAAKAAEVNGFKYSSANDENMTAYLAGLENEIGIRPQKKESKVKISEVNFQREYMPYGSVLIVDDMETNLYASRNLLEPYGMKIDTAVSGREAIEKIAYNRNYDIVFMDHLMPEMDGITAANAILERGYTGPIVALSANSAAGQGEIFLSAGFDAFLSKPIDAGKLNLLLNRFIRDKQSPDVLAEARAEMVRRADEKIKQRVQTINAGLIAVFVHDAEKAIKELEDYISQIEDGETGTPETDEADTEDAPPAINSYVINTHSMKSALKVMGEEELSHWALNLEEAGRYGRNAVILKETPAFIKTLRDYIVKLSPSKGQTKTDLSDGDKVNLRETLNEIRKACGIYDRRAVKDFLMELKKKDWPGEISQAIENMIISLLHSDFDRVFETISQVESFLDSL